MVEASIVELLRFALIDQIWNPGHALVLCWLTQPIQAGSCSQHDARVLTHLKTFLGGFRNDVLSHVRMTNVALVSAAGQPEKLGIPYK